MGKIIIRTNGIVTQFWEDNEANWEFFRYGQARDIHWKNVTDKFGKPKVFKDFNAAMVRYNERRKHLKTVELRAEKDWQYHIINEEEFDGLLNSKEKES